MTATGTVPPGNVKGEKAWTARRAVKKPEVRLTPGKGIQDLSVPLEDVIQQVVDQNRVRSPTPPPSRAPPPPPRTLPARRASSLHTCGMAMGLRRRNEQRACLGTRSDCRP